MRFEPEQFTPEQFTPGQIVVRRHFQHDLLSRVWVGRVAADDEHGTWMWVDTGSAHRDLGSADGRHLRAVDFAAWPAIDKAYDERPWGGRVLMFHPREGDYSVWLFFTDDLRLRHWYVNLERPAVRWEHGLDTVDYDLDVVVDPDLAWRWKDEEEFVERLAYPFYWVDDEAAVRAEGERLIKLAEAGQFPFDGTMTDFRPDRAWDPVTEMPAWWNAPRAW